MENIFFPGRIVWDQYDGQNTQHQTQTHFLLILHITERQEGRWGGKERVRWRDWDSKKDRQTNSVCVCVCVQGRGEEGGSDFENDF